ncbi:MAG TPA: transposase, partial [Bacillota bacterium]|nr:transposase [Bacillota bacterium]
YPIPPKEQPLFVGASLNDQGEPYYVKMKCIPRISKQINYNSTLRLGTEAFKRTQIDPSSPHVEFMIGRGKSNTFKKLFPIFAKARTWINKTFRGLGPRHFNAYLDEFCYRWNNLTMNNGIFDPLLHLCLSRRAISYISLTRY